MIKYLAFTITFTLFFSTTTIAAPGKPYVSGDFSQGQSVNILGNSFGVKPQSQPLVWDTFEQGTSGETIENKNAVIGDWDTGTGSSVPVYSTTQARTGTKSSYHRFQSGSMNASLAKNGSFPSFYLDFWVRITPDSNLSRNYKVWRAYGDYSGDDDSYQFDYVWYCNSGDYSMTMYAAPCQTDANDWQGVDMQVNQWMHFQIYFKESDPSTANGLIKHYINNTITTNTTTRITRCNSNHLNEIRIGHYWATDGVEGCSENPGGNVYIDDVYFDSSMAHIEIGNSSTYSASTHREVVIPTAWSASSISATVNTGTFAEGSTVYLYVIDENGDVSPASDPITIGESNTPTPVDGVCGSANDSSFSTAPSTNLCSAGTASAVSGAGPWTWTCNGINGGNPASCSASLLSSGVIWLTTGGTVITDPATGNAIGPSQ